MTFIRKHAALLSLLSAAMALVAAPYLIPEDPDSAVFRSGLLGTLLVLACCPTLRQAYVRADRRTLAVSLGFGLLLGGALGLGAELRFYGGLLPGLGSMVRRAAVPVLIAPLLGGLCARAMLLRPAARAKPLRLPMALYLAALLLCWLPLLIAYYPGMLNYDFYVEYHQFLDNQWDSRHPLLYIALCYAIYGAGRLLGQPTLAIFFTTLLRMLALASALAYACVFVQRRRAPAWALALMTAAFAQLPIFPVMAVSSSKDTLFSAALLVLSLLCWELLEEPQAFFASRKRCAGFVVMTVLTCHLRKNGVAALVLLPLMIAMLRSHRRRTASLCAVAAGASLLLSIGLNAALQPVEQPSYQLYSLPAQQLVRAYNLGNVTDEEKEEIQSWFRDNHGLSLEPHLADKAKGYLIEDRIAGHADEFMALWARIGRKNPRVYTEAFLMLNLGAWYPDDLSHAEIYRENVGYLQMSIYDMTDHGIVSGSLLPGVRALTERICRANAYQKLPILSLLLCTATPVWLLLFGCAMLVARRRTHLMAPVGGVAALWLTIFLGPCTLPRYMLPMFCLAPVLLAVAFLPTPGEAG
ncbi:MAG: DUF6020 family protein [Candidatus Ventricola sp.]